eukprot:15467529-Alexandrium_andersonii.AAC.1
MGGLAALVEDRFAKPWFEERDVSWGKDMFCLLCSSFATEEHLASAKHKKREAEPRWYGFVDPAPPPLPAAPPAPALATPPLPPPVGWPGQYCASSARSTTPG